MPSMNKKPVRMCIACRGRFSSDVLLRLQCKDGLLGEFTKFGRSFYVCFDCLKNKKKYTKSLMRQCRSADATYLSNQLKEIAAHNGKS